MDKYNIINEVKKSKKFIDTKIDRGFIRVNNIGKDIVSIYINKDEFTIQENDFDEYRGVFLYQEGENDIYDFKREIQNSKKYLSPNSFIIIRYSDMYGENIDYIEEDLVKTLTLKRFIDIESYTILPNEKRENKELIIIARWHIDLLYDAPEYESYTENYYRKKSCGGCGDKSKEGCNGCNKWL
ncbi:MAG: hypothetical protein E7214_11865 [Clostridium sp.]|nr:hypothetical protein [Clostridium sp.]